MLVPAGSSLIWNENGSLYRYDLIRFDVKQRSDARYWNAEAKARGDEPIRSTVLTSIEGTMLRGKVKFSFDMYWMDLKKAMVFLNYENSKIWVRCNQGTLTVEQTDE